MDLSLVKSVVMTFTFGLLMTSTLSMPTDEYTRARAEMLQADRSTPLGHQLTLDADEIIVSNSMVAQKAKLVDASRLGGEEYIPSVSYFRSKPMMESTLLFRLIQKMPKGAALHLHDQAIASIDWLVKNATYRDHLYMCVSKKTNLMEFAFNKTTPEPTSDCTWTLVADERKAAASVSEFDDSIKRNLSMLATDPLITYPTITQVWERFLQYFGQAVNIIFYEPMFRDYFRQALTEFYEDNVQYIELRSLFNGVYDLAGTVYGKEKAFQIYREVTEEFKKSHPDFIGAKFIMSSVRVLPNDVILQDIKETMEMRKAHPESMVGYDLVGQEDPNKSLLYYRDQLLYPGQVNPENPMPYFFHAAETNWQGTATDYNLIDAYLLNSTRIGHGFGLIKHPSLIKAFKEKGIAVEANPISNQVLGLVKDMRNHALVPLMADDFPVVVSSDDPVVWEAKPLSSDFYVAFMNMCGEDADLRFLKQLAINSIKYSAMTQTEKDEAIGKWQIKWKTFIKEAKDMIESASQPSSEDSEYCSADSSSSQCP